MRYIRISWEESLFYEVLRKDWKFLSQEWEFLLPGHAWESSSWTSCKEIKQERFLLERMRYIRISWEESLFYEVLRKGWKFLSQEWEFLLPGHARESSSWISCKEINQERFLLKKMHYIRISWEESLFYEVLRNDWKFLSQEWEFLLPGHAWESSSGTSCKEINQERFLLKRMHYIRISWEESLYWKFLSQEWEFLLPGHSCESSSGKNYFCINLLRRLTTSEIIEEEPKSLL